MKKKAVSDDAVHDVDSRISGLTRSRRAWFVSLGIAVIAFLLALGFSFTRFCRDVEFKTLDLRYRLRPSLTVRDDILMVDIDDESLETYGRWPWPRTVMADLLDGLGSQGAEHVLLDIEFLDPSRAVVISEQGNDFIQAAVGQTRRNVSDLITEALSLVESGHRGESVAGSLLGETGEVDRQFQLLNEVLTGAVVDPDAALTAALKRHGRTYLVCHFRDMVGNMAGKMAGKNGKDIDEKINELVKQQFVSGQGTMEVEERVEAVLASLPSVDSQRFRSLAEKIVIRESNRRTLLNQSGVRLFDLGGLIALPETGGLVPTLPMLSKAARGVGFSNASPDQDGTFRRLPLFIPGDEMALMQAAFRLAVDMLEADVGAIRFKDSRTVQLPRKDGTTLEVPLDRHGQFLLNWAGGWKTFRHVSACRILDQRLLMKGQWRLLCEADERYLGGELGDLAETPFSPGRLQQAREIVLPAITDLVDRITRQIETGSRFQEDSALKSRVTGRLESVKAVLTGFTRLESERRSLDEELKKSVSGSTCFVELSASATTDLGVTPFEEKYPMAGTHANLLNSFLTGAFLKESSFGWPCLAAAALALLPGVLLPFLGNWGGTGLALGLAAAYVLLCFILFSTAGLIIEMVFPLVTLVLTFIAVSMYLRILAIRAFLLYRSEKAALERDIELAKRIQRRLRPSSYPKMEGMDIAGRTRPARSLAGDFYAFFQLEESKVGCAIADISGKGVSAALLMNMIRSALKTVLATRGDRPDVMNIVNRLVSSEEIIKESSFATCMYLVLNLKLMTVRFSNAGHNAILLFRQGEEAYQELFIGGVPLGIFKKMDYGQVEAPLKPGDILVLYTDGINEAHNPDEQQFGLERFVEVINRSRHLSAEEILQAVFDAVDEFAAKRGQYDDMTTVVFKIGDNVKGENTTVE